MNKMVLALASAMAYVGVACAAGTDNVTLAAQDTSKIPEIVKSLSGQKGYDFAADVISAIAAMPGKPAKKVKTMTKAAAGFLGAVPEKELPQLLANLTANVPFNSLPAWVDAFKGPFDAFAKDIPDANYNKMANDVMSMIGKLNNTSDADKTVISAFATKLLARGKDDEEKTAWAGKVAYPKAYADQVKAAMPGVFAGNYEAVLGPDAAVVKSDDIRMVEPMTDSDKVIKDEEVEENFTGLNPVVAAQDRTGIDRPEPLLRRTYKGGKEWSKKGEWSSAGYWDENGNWISGKDKGNKKNNNKKPKPPKPVPYASQF